jgi:hypothetical protein
MSRSPRDRNRRRASRAKVQNLVGYSDKRSGHFYTLLGSAVTVDLSETGVRVRTVEPLPIAGILMFDLKIGGEVHRVEGRVVWGEELIVDKEYEFGVHFADLEPAVRDKLRVYVSVRQAREAE